MHCSDIHGKTALLRLSLVWKGMAVRPTFSAEALYMTTLVLNLRTMVSSSFASDGDESVIAEGGISIGLQRERSIRTYIFELLFA